MISSFEVLIFIGALFATWHLAPSHIRSRVLELSRRWARTVPIKPKLEPIAAGKGEESTEKKEGWEDLTPGRRPGEWRSTTFEYPDIESFAGDIHQHKQIPYRPFRWGDTYPINLGVYPMRWEMWLEVDNEYLHTHNIRKHRTSTRGDKAVRTLPFDYPLVPSSIPMSKPLAASNAPPIPPTLRASPSACAREVCSEMCSYLGLKYPQLFRVTYVPLSEPTGEAFDIDSTGNSFVKDKRVKSVEMLETGEKWDLDVDDPMKICGLLMQDDLAIMQEREDGQVYFVSGSICTAGFWRLEDKIGLPLDEIHARGRVPQYKEKLQFSMSRLFLKMRPDRPVSRNNYFMQVGDDIAWSADTNGPEEYFDQAIHGPKEGSEGAKMFAGVKRAERKEDVWFRTERQTLRRMPKTGCILFTIRTYFLRVADFVHEPGVPGRLANGIRTWPDDVAEYKAKELYADIVLPWLDELHQKQIEDGITTADNQNRTYPF